MQTKEFKTTIGTFGKGLPGSKTINFGVSGGANCSDTCPLKKSGLCYAISTEKLKPSITVNLERKQANFTGYLEALTSDKALTELNTAPWIRASAFGSIPMPGKITDKDKTLLAKLASGITNHSKLHFPVETKAKADLLRAAGFHGVRVSAANNTRKAKTLIDSGYPVSITIAGEKRAVGKNKRLNSQKAFDYASKLRAKGITAKVCPAIPGSAKCGNCKLCANPDIQAIIYPLH